jgi:8-oxo-dGTP diphosphatase
LSFSGAKLALFLGSDLLVIKRDSKPDIPYPGHWDLPGGGREGLETPQECALRETREEVGLKIRPSDLIWSNRYERPRGYVWFFASHLPLASRNLVEFGSEGQGWMLMSPQDYCLHPLAIPHFVQQLRLYMSQDAFRTLVGKTPRC